MNATIVLLFSRFVLSCIKLNIVARCKNIFKNLPMRENLWNPAKCSKHRVECNKHVWLSWKSVSKAEQNTTQSRNVSYRAHSCELLCGGRSAKKKNPIKSNGLRTLSPARYTCSLLLVDIHCRTWKFSLRLENFPSSHASMLKS